MLGFPPVHNVVGSYVSGLRGGCNVTHVCTREWSIEGVLLFPPCAQPCLRFPPALVQELVQSTVSTLEQTWAWVVSVLDVAEGQLQQGHMFDTQAHVCSRVETVD